MDLILESVHCLGPDNTNSPRQAITQFHPICKKLNISLTEDLSREDKKRDKKASMAKIQTSKEGGPSCSEAPIPSLMGKELCHDYN